jgi:hypothetical protein
MEKSAMVVVVVVAAKEIRTSGFDLRHWKAMVRSSVSRAVKVAAGFGVDISGRCCMVG